MIACRRVSTGITNVRISLAVSRCTCRESFEFLVKKIAVVCRSVLPVDMAKAARTCHPYC